MSWAVAPHNAGWKTKAAVSPIPHPQFSPLRAPQPASGSSFLSLQSAAASDENSSEEENRAPMELPPHSSPTLSDMASSEPSTFVGRVKSYFNAPSDGLTFRQRLAKLGLNVALSYGWVSNMSYSVTVSLAWYIFSRQSGKSPLAPGQWKGFLAVYAGFFVFNNLVRPARMALAVGVAPAFDRVVSAIQNKLRVNKGTAIFVTVLIANVIGTTLFMSSGILLAATLAGVPVFPK